MEKENEPLNTLIKEESSEKESVGDSFWELARFAIIAIAIVIPIRVFIAQPFIVSGSSMVPTFENGQYLVVDEIFFIKRIIGLPNETINIKGSTVTIIDKEHPEGFVLDQSYVKNPGNNEIHLNIKSDEYFVMGDNRTASSDSRYWGPVPRRLLIGRAFLRLLPLSKVGFMPGNYNQVE
jgi:signal peptidase I